MMTDTVLTLDPSTLPAPLSGHGHDHGQDHDHAHPHGDHHHAPAFRPPFSLVRMSVAGRLALALTLSAGVWAAVFWALAPISG